jgi:hypothetical protein
MSPSVSISAIAMATVWLLCFVILNLDDRCAQWAPTASLRSKITIEANASHRNTSTTMITFASGCCAVSMQRNCEAALKHGFHTCHVHTMADIDSRFIKHHHRIFNATRGAGYWLWKPWLILQYVQRARDGDVIMYTDASTRLIATITPLVSLVEEFEIVPFRLQDKHVEEKYTKRDAYVLLDMEPIVRSQTHASYILLKKTPRTIAFVSEWLHYASDHRAITDEPSVFGNESLVFEDHRHDQAIYSLLVRKYNLTRFPCISQHNRFDPKPSEFEYGQLIDHHRLKQ